MPSLRSSALVILLVAGCAEVGVGTATIAAEDAAAATDAPAFVDTTPEGPTIVLETGPFEVLPTGEQFTCTYTDTIADEDLAVWSTTGTQVEYGHHITLYYTTMPRPPQQIPCFSPSSMDKKLVAQSATETARAVLALPDGAAFRVPKGAQLIIFSHYVNAKGEVFTASDTLTIHLREAASVTTWLDSYTFSVESFQVPPHSEGYQSVTTCTVDRDLQVLLFIGHMHELGKHYRLDVVDDAGQVQDTLAEHVWAPTFGVDPPVHWFTLEQPLFIKAGTRLRQTCEWSNEGADAATFPTEMCLAAFTYFPGQGELLCKHDPPGK